MKLGFGTPHRQKVEEQEAWVGQWLDLYFYPHITRQFLRNTDTETQKRGIDVYVTGNTKCISIDEKASVQWTNVGLDKYSVELSLLNDDGKEIDGWYMTDTSISTHMEVIFIDSGETYNDRYLANSAITQATVVILDKKVFQSKLDSMGWSKQNLRKKNDLIRQAYGLHGDNYWRYENCGRLDYTTPHFFVQTKPYQKERGICIQFTKQFLIDCSDYSAIVTKNKIERLK